MNGLLNVPTEHRPKGVNGLLGQSLGLKLMEKSIKRTKRHKTTAKLQYKEMPNNQKKTQNDHT